MLSSLPTWIDHWARERGNETVIAFEGRHLRWSEFAQRVRHRAAQLHALGVRAGDRVACLSHNRPEYLEVFWAAQRVGAVFVALNTRLAAPELARIVSDSAPVVLVREDDDSLVSSEALTEYGAPVPALVRLAPFGRPFALDDIKVAPDSTLDDRLHSSTVDAPAAILYTSGSTGQPKGAVITHGNIMALTQMWQASFGQTAGDRNLVSMPLCFTGGLLASSMTTFCTGARLVILRQFSPAGALAAVASEQVTYGIVVPTMLERLVASPEFETADLNALRGLQVGGAAPTEATIRSVQRRGIGIVNAYGLTEASAGATLTLTADEAQANPNAVGRPTLGNSVRVTGADGSALSAGAVGELEVIGPLVFAGYWNNAQATEEARHDGWLCTGDLAEIAADGVVTLRGRKKDMIITGGLNVYPAEIEQVLTAIPGISEAAVVGRPDRQWGETIIAYVLPTAGTTPDLDDVRARCRAELAGYKVPGDVRVIAEFPRLASGKIDKISLRSVTS